MKRLILSAAVIALAATACKKNADKNFDARGTNAGPLALPEKTLPNVIREDLFLSKDTLWLLDGKVYVDDNHTLIVEQGARIEGVWKANNAESSALVITRGSQLFAVGTSDEPIVFSAHLDGNNPSATPGDWGGVVLMGNAPVNQTSPVPTIEGIDLPTVPDGVDVHYGGSDCCDKSGELQYVRIEYAGAQLTLDNELNGLTLGGVGSGTVLDFIEVAYGADDAFEFFGGCVNAKHLYALAPNDDAFDFDLGYKGHVQFAVSQLRDVLAYSANPNGIECDNDAIGSGATPITKPTISNMTVIGLQTASAAAADALLNGALFRRNSAFNMKNSILMGFPTGLNHTNVNTNPDKNFSNNLVQAYTTVDVTGFPVTSGCGDASSNVSYLGGDANDNILLTNPFDNTAPDYRPQSGSPALSNATSFSCLVAPTDCEENWFGFENVNYRGAFGSVNWLAGWAKYDY